MGILPIFMSLYYMNAWYLERSEKGIGFPGTIVTDGYELHVDPVNETCVIRKSISTLTADPFLQPHQAFFE